MYFGCTLGLHCCVSFSLAVVSRGYASRSAQAFHCGDLLWSTELGPTSPPWARQLWPSAVGLNSWGTWA